jgi:hypothetical protein
MKSLVLRVLVTGLVAFAASLPADADSNDQVPMKATESTLDGSSAVPEPTVHTRQPIPQGPQPTPLHASQSAPGGDASKSTLNGSTTESKPTPLHASESTLNGSASENKPIPLHASESTLNGGVSAQGKANPTLHGGAAKTGAISVPTQHFKFNAEQLRAAAAMYAGDVRTFYSEVQRYDAMLKDFNFVRGQCNENETAYQAKVQQDQLNLKTLVIPASISAQPPPPPPVQDVQPPKVCCGHCLATGKCGPHLGTGGGGGGGAMAPSGSARIDAMRESSAQRELAKNGQMLKNLEEEGQFLGQKAINQAEIETRQQQLVSQFEKLQDRYKMLKVEKDTLVNSAPGH